MTDAAKPRIDNAPKPTELSPLRRRTILGVAAWSAPAIVLATAAPARAASIPPTAGGVLVASAYASWYPNWDADASTNVDSVVFGAGFQNHDYDGSDAYDVAPIVTLTATFIVPLAGFVPTEELPLPRYGVGNSEGDPNVAGVSISPPSFASDFSSVTVVVTYTGTIPAGSSVQVYNVWCESPDQPSAATIAVSADAVHEGGDTSSDSNGAEVRAGADYPVPWPEGWPAA